MARWWASIDVHLQPWQVKTGASSSASYRIRTEWQCWISTSTGRIGIQNPCRELIKTRRWIDWRSDPASATWWMSKPGRYSHRKQPRSRRECGYWFFLNWKMNRISTHRTGRRAEASSTRAVLPTADARTCACGVLGGAGTLADARPEFWWRAMDWRASPRPIHSCCTPRATRCRASRWIRPTSGTWRSMCRECTTPSASISTGPSSDSITPTSTWTLSRAWTPATCPTSPRWSPVIWRRPMDWPSIGWPIISTGRTLDATFSKCRASTEAPAGSSSATVWMNRAPSPYFLKEGNRPPWLKSQIPIDFDV